MSEPRIVPEVVGLFEFLMRDLEIGTPYPNMSDSDLRRVLFFNKVVYDNIDEIYQKCRETICADTLEYMGCLYSRFLRNMSETVLQMTRRSNWRLEVDSTFEMKLLSLDLNGLRFEDVAKIENGELVSADLVTGGIYYVGLKKSGNERIPCIISAKISRSDFREPMVIKTDSGSVYWKTDECIRLFLENRGILGVTSTRLTVEDGLITKCEFNGDPVVLNQLSPLFDKDCLMVSSPFVIVEDLWRIVERECGDSSETQDRSYTASDLLTQDRLIEYPQESFMNSVDFILAAIDNPRTRAISMTIYRIGKDPTLFYALTSAAIKGIRVSVNIELTASGESINYFWAKELKRAGVHVTFYKAGEIKVHAKVILIEQDNNQFISQISTGNYHTKTTRSYTDLAVNTTDPELAEQCKNLFQLFDGGKVKFDDNLLVSTINLRATLVNLIEEEAAKGSGGFIFIKCNALDDPDIIQALHDAATAGATIDLVVRGSCCWVPFEQLNLNVRIRSFVWEKLEHSRVYAFGTKNPKLYVGSADLITRKLDNRIEVLAKVNNPSIRRSLMKYIERYMHSRDHSWIMEADRYGQPHYRLETPNV